ncbi:MAG: S1/P1 nuclease [Proteobacteria bacterium]|nr:S1/P1 nuclease [Pseudomonadota bacterium]
MTRPFALCCLLLLLIALPAQAWRPLGHRMVARLAEPRLTPLAQAEVSRLLATEHLHSLADVANWADELRERDPQLGRRSAKWHYVNFSGDDCRYDAARDCPGGDCVVAAIDAQAAILADRTRDDAARLQALKFVVHFVGDVHQPLHAGNGHDRGGNDVQVHYRGKGTHLHALWDLDMLAAARLDEDAYVRRLSSPVPARAAGVVSPAAWAEQSCRIVRTPGFYPRRAKVDDAYLAHHRATAERQVQLAGARLAALLNATLD